MRRTLGSIGVAAAALSLAGFALAGSIGGSATPVDASFDAAKTRSETRVCTGTDGDTYQVSEGRYEGTATSGNADLNGPVSIRIKSVYNQTDKLGVVDGWIKWRAADGSERRGYTSFSGLLGDGGAVNGWVAGRVLGNLTGTLTPDVSFRGELGKGGTITSKAVVLSRISCDRPETPRPSVKLEVKGEVDGLLPNAQAPTQISVKPRDGSASQVCNLKAGVSPSVAGLAVKTSTTPGSYVEMKCGPVDNAMTLLRLEVKR